MLSPRGKSSRTIVLDARTMGVVGAAAVLIAVLSFLVGRWSAGEGERAAEAAVAARTGSEAASEEPEPIPVRQSPLEQDLSFLDEVDRESADAGSAGRPPSVRTQRTATPPEEPGPASPAGPRNAAPSSAATPPPPPADAQGYLIQVFASQYRERAEEVRRHLSRKGYPAQVVTTQVQSRTYYRVRVGPYRQKSRADTVAERLKREENLSIWIIRP